MFINTIANYPTDSTEQTAYNMIRGFLADEAIDDMVDLSVHFYMCAYPELFDQACSDHYENIHNC